ncbi:MAG: TerB family tellurite resistance protein [Nannocystis sp.]|nr:TerB family tellurite resistance protein [Nannocystis sp.]
MEHPKNWTTLHILGFLYLTFSYTTDGSLDKREVAAMIKRLQRWSPNDTQESIANIIREVGAWYRLFGSDDERRMMASDYAYVLKDELDEMKRMEILADLSAIARADGKVSAGELGFIDAIREIFGVTQVR